MSIQMCALMPLDAWCIKASEIAPYLDRLDLLCDAHCIQASQNTTSISSLSLFFDACFYSTDVSKIYSFNIKI